MTNSRRIKSNLQGPIPAAMLAPVLAVILLAASGAAFAAERKLAFSVEGVVQEVLVKAGQALKAGAAMARLDPRPRRWPRRSPPCGARCRASRR